MLIIPHNYTVATAQTVCYKMLLSRAELRLLCYNKLRAIACPLRQQHLGTFLAMYKQLKDTYTFKITFKNVICIRLYTFSLHNRFS